VSHPTASAATRRAPFFYGWTILLALSWTELTSWGILYYGFSVFVAPLGSELGWSSVAINGAFSVSLLCSGIAAVWIGRLVDRLGPRPIMTAGSILAALLLLAWAAVGNLAAFYLIWVGLGVAMAATLYEPAFAAVATWFVTKRARALTILTFVAGLASVVYIPLIAWLIGRLGWRGALVALAAILAIATIPPRSPRSSPSRRSRRTPCCCAAARRISACCPMARRGRGCPARRRPSCRARACAPPPAAAPSAG